MKSSKWIEFSGYGNDLVMLETSGGLRQESYVYRGDFTAIVRVVDLGGDDTDDTDDTPKTSREAIRVWASYDVMDNGCWVISANHATPDTPWIEDAVVTVRPNKHNDYAPILRITFPDDCPGVVVDCGTHNRSEVPALLTL